MQDGDRVRVTCGYYKDLVGELVGEPSSREVGVKSKDTGQIFLIPYPPNAMTADQLLELIPDPPSQDGTSPFPQPA